MRCFCTTCLPAMGSGRQYSEAVELLPVTKCQAGCSRFMGNLRDGGWAKV